MCVFWCTNPLCTFFGTYSRSRAWFSHEFLLRVSANLEWFGIVYIVFTESQFHSLLILQHSDHFMCFPYVLGIFIDQKLENPRWTYTWKTQFIEWKSNSKTFNCVNEKDSPVFSFLVVPFTNFLGYISSTPEFRVPFIHKLRIQSEFSWYFWSFIWIVHHKPLCFRDLPRIRPQNLL